MYSNKGGFLLGVLSIQSGSFAVQSCELSQRPPARGHSVIGKLPKFPLGLGGIITNLPGGLGVIYDLMQFF